MMASKSFSIPAPAIVSLSTRRNWFDFDGITGKTPAGLAFAGANGTYFDSAGVLQDAVANTPRFDYHPATLASRGVLIEPARTNSLRNGTAQGATIGAPGAAPTNWTIVATGLTRTIVGTGIEDGIPFIDIRFAGTTGTTADNIVPEMNNFIAGVAGEIWTQSAYVRLIAGSLNNITMVLMRTLGYNSTPAVQETQPNQDITSVLSGGSLKACRVAKTYTLVNASTVTVVPFITITHSSGVAVDLTLRIGLWQFEKGAFATSPIKTSGSAVTRAADLPTAALGTFSRASGKSWFNAAGVLTDYAADTRVYDFDPATGFSRGLLVEPARTNGIRNSTAQGGGAGVLPTYWNATSGAGMTVTYLGTGTEDGIPYFDVRFQGTPGATSSWGLRFELAGFIAATLGQTWTQSAFVRMIAGSKANLAALNLAMHVLDAGAVIIETSNATLLSVVDGSKLSVCRASGSYTIANASAVSIRSQITISYTNALPVDITLRVGLPQLEQGSGATSPIKTSGAAVTRAADVASFTGPPFYSVLEVELEAAAAGALASVHGVGASDAAGLASVGAGPAWAVSTKTNNVEQGPLAPAGTPATGTIYRIAHAVDTNNLRACVNGGTVVQDTGASVPVPANISFGADGDGANQSAFWLRRARVLKGSPTNSAMQDF